MNKIDVINRALAHIGGYKLENINENTLSAETFDSMYASLLDEMLASHNWSEAIEYVELAQLAETPVFGWGYIFQLPTNCLRVISVNEDDQYTQSDKFEIVGNKIYSDVSTINLKYIKRIDIQDAKVWFTQIFAKYLAAHLSIPLLQNENKRTQLLNEINSLDIPKAYYLNAIQSKIIRKPSISKWSNNR